MAMMKTCSSYSLPQYIFLRDPLSDEKVTYREATGTVNYRSKMTYLTLSPG